MRRREFLRNAALGASGGTLLAACGRGRDEEEGTAGAAPTSPRTSVTWRCASSFPRGLDTIFGAAERLAEELEALSGGRFRLRVYPSGEIVPGLQVLDAVQQGTVQVGQSASYYYTGKHAAFAFDTAVPFGLTARQQIAWLLEGGGRELLEPLFSRFNVLAFFGGSTGAQMGGWFNREIHTPEDIRGLKMRIPGPGGEVMSALGANVQVLAGGDIYPALERGAIDATEWIGPYDDEKLGFHKVAKYYYYPGFWEAGPTLSFYVNQRAWETLSPEFKAIFRVAAQSAGLHMLARYDARNPEALKRLRESGVQFRAFSDQVLLAARQVSERLMEESAAKDPVFRDIYEPWKRFRDQAFTWFSVAEQAYQRFAFGTPAL
jgi:TRAP-type mannitol/chloroaromatic compound transport system substrate-binding protein